MLDMTVSICIDAVQIVKDYKNLRLLTEALYMVARHACDMGVVELIVLDEETNKGSLNGLRVGALLQYFVTPQYLVKETFKTAFSKGLDKKIFNEAKKYPVIKSIKTYMKPWSDKDCVYREGISIVRKIRREKKASGKVKKSTAREKSTEWVNVGLPKVVELVDNERVPFGVRVTVEIVDREKYTGKIVSAKDAWRYCGYVVRGACDSEGVFAGAGAVTDGEGYSKVVGVSGGVGEDGDGEGGNNVVEEEKTSSAPAEGEAVLLAVACLREVWDGRIRCVGSPGGDVCVQGLAKLV